MARFALTLLRLLLPLVWGVVRTALWTMVTELAVLSKAMWEASDRIADEWTKQAIWKGVDTRLAGKLRIFFKFVALVSLAVGWCLLAYLTVAILHWLLR